MKKILAIAIGASFLVGCGGSSGGYDEAECNEAAAKVAELRESLESMDRSTDFLEFTYQMQKDNLEQLEVAYRGLCG